MDLWIAENYTPFSVGRAFARDAEGTETWVVVVRATLTILRNGALAVAEEQVPVSRSALYRGEPGSSSMHWESDFPFTKQASDIIVDAQAWAPAGRPAQHVDVGLRVGKVRKQLRVTGERHWQRGLDGVLTPSRPAPFVSLAINYENAWGGLDPNGGGFWRANPVGRGHASDPAALEHKLVPSVEDPRDPLPPATKAPRAPAGFGAIAPHWTPRVRYAGTYDETWERERAPLWPADFDPRFFQVAPADQQVAGFLQGGEQCELHNLSSEGSVQFVLPRLEIQTTTYLGDQEQRRIGKLHLLVVEPELRRIQMIWHAAVDCHGREHTLRRTRVRCEGERVCLSRSTPTA